MLYVIAEASGNNPKFKNPCLRVLLTTVFDFVPEDLTV